MLEIIYDYLFQIITIEIIYFIYDSIQIKSSVFFFLFKKLCISIFLEFKEIFSCVDLPLAHKKSKEEII